MSEEENNRKLSSLVIGIVGSSGTPRTLAASRSSDIANLKVPTTPIFLCNDNNTPTPVRTIISDYLDANHMMPDLRQNPFDEHFRKAAAEQTNINTKQFLTQLSTSSVKTANLEDTLNTPTILSILDQVSLVATTVPNQSQVTNPIQINANANFDLTRCRSIAPATMSGAVTNNLGDKAQLVIKLPSGQAIHLSDMPIVSDNESTKVKASTKNALRSNLKRSPENFREDFRVNGEQNLSKNNNNNKKSRKNSEDEKLQLLKESNREAAKRSRAKRKAEMNAKDSDLKKIKSLNRNLTVENNALRAEVAKLKSLLEPHVSCEVTKKLNQEKLLIEEIRPKFLLYQSAEVPVIKVVAASLEKERADIDATSNSSSSVQISSSTSGGTVKVIGKTSKS